MQKPEFHLIPLPRSPLMAIPPGHRRGQCRIAHPECLGRETFQHTGKPSRVIIVTMTDHHRVQLMDTQLPPIGHDHARTRIQPLTVGGARIIHQPVIRRLYRHRQALPHIQKRHSQGGYRWPREQQRQHYPGVTQPPSGQPSWQQHQQRGQSGQGQCRPGQRRLKQRHWRHVLQPLQPGQKCGQAQVRHHQREVTGPGPEGAQQQRHKQPGNHHQGHQRNRQQVGNRRHQANSVHQYQERNHQPQKHRPLRPHHRLPPPLSTRAAPPAKCQHQDRDGAKAEPEPGIVRGERVPDQNRHPGQQQAGGGG